MGMHPVRHSPIPHARVEPRVACVRFTPACVHPSLSHLSSPLSTAGAAAVHARARTFWPIGQARRPVSPIAATVLAAHG
eukprot:2558743-Prymnesium_polylepis.2